MWFNVLFANNQYAISSNFMRKTYCNFASKGNVSVLAQYKIIPLSNLNPSKQNFMYLFSSFFCFPPFHTTEYVFCSFMYTNFMLYQSIHDFLNLFLPLYVYFKSFIALPYFSQLVLVWLCPGAAPGCLLRRGGKMSRYCCARPIFLRQPWKKKKITQRGGGGGGGTPTHFFPTSKIFNKHFHKGVGVVSSWPWLSWQAKKKKNRGAIAPLPPPPPPQRELCAKTYGKILRGTDGFKQNNSQGLLNS